MKLLEKQKPLECENSGADSSNKDEMSELENKHEQNEHMGRKEADRQEGTITIHTNHPAL